MIVRSKAPLRIGIAGGGSDVSPYSDEFGGCVLNATIDMYAYCTLEINNSNQIIIEAKDKNEYFETNLADYIKVDDLLPLHKGVYNRIVRDFNNGQPISFRMVTYSDAPAGSGLGSSSTMVVAIIKAFTELLNLPLGEYDIAHLAYEIERIDLGLSGGKQDQYAATFGGVNFIEFYKDDRVVVNPLRIKNWIINELESSMILYYTGTSRESAKIIDEQVENAKNKNNKCIEAFHELKESAFIMKEAILKGDFDTFSECLGRGWEAKKKTASVVSNSFLDEIYQEAINAGAKAGKVSGAGGGGFMMFFTEPTKKLNVVNALNKFGGKVMNVNFTSKGTQGWVIRNDNKLNELTKKKEIVQLIN